MKEKFSRLIRLTWTVLSSPFSLFSPECSVSPSFKEEHGAVFSSSPRWSNDSAFLMFSRSFMSEEQKPISDHRDPSYSFNLPFRHLQWSDWFIYMCAYPGHSVRWVPIWIGPLLSVGIWVRGVALDPERSAKQMKSSSPSSSLTFNLFKRPSCNQQSLHVRLNTSQRRWRRLLTFNSYTPTSLKHHIISDDSPAHLFSPLHAAGEFIWGDSKVRQHLSDAPGVHPTVGSYIAFTAFVYIHLTDWSKERDMTSQDGFSSGNDRLIPRMHCRPLHWRPCRSRPHSNEPQWSQKVRTL